MDPPESFRLEEEDKYGQEDPNVSQKELDFLKDYYKNGTMV